MFQTVPVVARIVSGGQTGADRAGLDVAISLGLEYGGWCPAGGWAEDLVDPPGLLKVYPMMRESPSADPEARTRLNVRDSHATLIVRSPDASSVGTRLTEATAVALGRPLLVTTGDPGDPGDPDDVVPWLLGLGRGITLNVAGPRESEQPGAYATTVALLRAVVPPGSER